MTTATTPCPCLAELKVINDLYETDPSASTMHFSVACGFCWTSHRHGDDCEHCAGSELAIETYEGKSYKVARD